MANSDIITNTLFEINVVFDETTPKHLKARLWHWLLVIKDEVPKPCTKEERKEIELLYKKFITMIEYSWELIHLATHQALWVDGAKEQLIPNPAFVSNSNPAYRNASLFYDGSVQALSLEEYLNPYECINSFFKWQSVVKWSHTSKYWKIKATAKDEYFDDGYLENPLQCYHLLLKLIDVCCLLCKMENDGLPNTPLNYFFAAEQLPAYSSAETILCPFESLYHLLGITGITELFSSLNVWKDAATSKKRSWQKGGAKSLLQLHDLVQILAELAFMIKSVPYLHASWLLSEKWAVPKDRKLKKPEDILELLTAEEQKNPFDVLNNELPHNMECYRDNLREYLEAALDKEKVFDYKYFKLDSIKKVIEALYVINYAVTDLERCNQLFRVKLV